MNKAVKGILTGSGLYLAAIAPRMLHRPETLPDVYYAHRGLYDNSGEAPENTLPAFERAVKAGYGIELDVRLTLDGRVVVAHDPNLLRICGVDRDIDTLTFAQLHSYRIMNSQETVPLFSDVLRLVDGKVPLIIEIKVKDFARRICEKTDALLAGYDGWWCIESFHPGALMWYRRRHPEVCRGQLSSNFQKHDDAHSPGHYIMRYLLADFLSRPDFIAYNCLDQNAVSMNLCRFLFRCPTVAWTVKSERELEQCRTSFDYFIFEGFCPAKSGQAHRF